jgi:hypothetical protein
MPFTAAMTGRRDASISSVRWVADIGAGGEELRPVAGDDHRAARLIRLGGGEPFGKTVDHIAVDGIRRWMVDGERDHCTLALDTDDVMENLTHELCLPRCDDGVRASYSKWTRTRRGPACSDE